MKVPTAPRRERDLPLRIERTYRRLMQTCTNRPLRVPGDPAIRTAVRDALGLDRFPAPSLRVAVGAWREGDGFRRAALTGESWPGVPLAAHLYAPLHDRDDRHVGILVACGHGKGGKSNPAYADMAIRLARRGATALVPDNLGQGERLSPGPGSHGDAVHPFACGLSVQGLIVAETLAWLDGWRSTGTVQRTGAVGNSGGGLLTLMLAALDSRLDAVASTGYPSTFEYIARKGKKHCHCNLLPGVCGRVEMGEVYGLFAPRPLLLMQGATDHFFSQDAFHECVRETRAAYRRAGAEDRLDYRVAPGGHAWDVERRAWLADYFARVFDLASAGGDVDCVVDDSSSPLPDEPCYAAWPSDAPDLDTLAGRLTGCAPTPGARLWDVYPSVEGIDAPDDTAFFLHRGSTAQVLAQWECFMRPAR